MPTRRANDAPGLGLATPSEPAPHDPSPPYHEIAEEARMSEPPPGSLGLRREDDDPWADEILERTPWRLVSAYRSGTITCRFPVMARKAQEPRRQRKPRVRPPDGLLTKGEAAAKLGCSTKTLDGHVAAGALRYVTIGHGTKRPRRMFTDVDLDTFIANQTRKDAPCPPSRTRVRRSGDTTSRSEVIAFTARRNARPSGKRKR